MAAKKRSWKDVLDERRKANFIGRADYLAAFSDNLAADEPNFLLFFVTGEGGVGKSQLLLQFAESADSPDASAIAIICDEQQPFPAAAMGYIAEQLGKRGIRSREFDERHKTYQSRREEIESDAKAPRGALDLLVRGMTDFAIKSARRTPGVGVFVDYLDEKAAGEALALGVNYLMDRVSNKDEVKLLREPEATLTPLFVELLEKACEKQRVVLMFDVFERTREALEPWLLKLLDFEFGEFDTGLTFVVSGRDAPEQDWTHLSVAESICHVTLEPFTEDETRLYLQRQEIVDEALIAQLYEDTGGMPVLLELLAGTKPQPGTPLPDISKDAVKRFLQWIPEEERRQVALLAAVPRQFSIDVLSAALGRDATNEFRWLSAQSYIRTSTARGWHYHERVRELMLRYMRHTVPGELTASHRRLADFFAAQQELLALDDKAAYDNESWRKLETEKLYHLLCERRKGDITVAVNAFLASFRWRWEFAQDIVRVCEQASHEVAVQEVKECVHVLAGFYRAYDKDEFEEFTSQAGSLNRRDDLGPIALVGLLSRRGATYQQMGKYEDALADFDRAIALDEKYAWALANRGLTHQLMGKYAEALADFDRAIALDEKLDWAIAYRGVTYRLMGKHAEALADFDRAIALDEKSAWAIASRGETYRLMGKHAEALADFDRAIGLDEKNAWAIAQRGETYREMGKREEALADLDRAIGLDEKDVRAIACRGLTYMEMGKFDEALADFDLASALDDKHEWAFVRGLCNRIMGRYIEALADLWRVNPANEVWKLAVGFRGEVCRLLGHLDEAEVDLTRAVETDEQESRWRYQRALLYRQLGEPARAEEDLRIANDLATSKYESSSADSSDGLGLALCRLASREVLASISLYDSLLSQGAPTVDLRLALMDLKELAAACPDIAETQTVISKVGAALGVHV